jgi:SAM-dependent methyltransferase
MTAAPTRANYGLDAPGVVRTLFLVAAVGLLTWPLGLTLEADLWWLGADPPRIRIALWGMGLGVGGVCLTMGLWMLSYSYGGKQRQRDRLLDSIPWRGDEAVLDVGCGRGLMLIGAARRAPKGRAVGVDLWQGEDLSGNSPEATRANAQAEGVAERVEVRTGDARKLPFGDASFDVVVSSAALHNIYQQEERKTAVREIARVLKPGGRALIADIRHLDEYAAVLRQSGCDEVQSRSGPGALLAQVFTFGSLRPGTLTARRAPG